TLANNKTPRTDSLSYEFYKLAREKSQNIISLISKKDDSLEEISNWRLILLTNCDIKIFIKIIANQLNVICADIVGLYQRGFVNERLIQNAAMDVLIVLRNQIDQSKYYWLLLLDQQKAFDRVNQAYIMDSAIEPLLKCLYERIHSIEIKNQCFKIAAYVEDLAIGNGSQSDWLK
ncbi:18635_t:CDS:2, partial [Gigaspora rosea]